MELFHVQIIQLKEIFEKNGYDNNAFRRCFQTFLNKIYSEKVPQHTVHKKYLYFAPLFREIVAFSKIKF